MSKNESAKMSLLTKKYFMKTYKETYPDYNDPSSKRSDIYSNTIIEAMNCEEDSREKIIKQISKSIVISKK